MGIKYLSPSLEYKGGPFYNSPREHDHFKGWPKAFHAYKEFGLSTYRGSQGGSIQREDWREDRECNIARYPHWPCWLFSVLNVTRYIIIGSSALKTCPYRDWECMDRGPLGIMHLDSSVSKEHINPSWAIREDLITSKSKLAGKKCGNNTVPGKDEKSLGGWELTQLIEAVTIQNSCRTLSLPYQPWIKSTNMFERLPK